MAVANPQTVAPPPKGRLLFGGAVFVIGLLCPLLVPLVVATDLSTEWKTVLSGLLLLGIPELFMLAAAAILGKAGFDYLKGKLWSFLRDYAPRDTVSHTRYRIGLAMFLLPLIFGWLTPYVLPVIPDFETHRIAYGVPGDLLLLASLFVLGGDFWDKLRALFVRDAKARFPNREPDAGLGG